MTMKAPAPPPVIEPVEAPATRAKATKAKATKAPKAKVEKVAAPAEKAKVRRNYRANRHPLHHPYQDKMVPVSGMVELYPDSWVDVQVKAKVITDLGAAG